MEFKSPNEEIVNYFLDKSIPLVCLSLGENGIMLSDGQKKVHIVPPEIKEKNPVGAGDAALAGLIHSIEKEESLNEMAKWAVASGSAAAKSKKNCFSSLKEVEAVLKQLKVENET